MENKIFRSGRDSVRYPASLKSVDGILASFYLKRYSSLSQGCMFTAESETIFLYFFIYYFSSLEM
jgi:hypothetical protein